MKRQYRQYLIIMVLTSSQRAALRAKKALADGNTGFKPRGVKNKRAFEDLKRQSVSGTPNISASNDVSDESPLHKRIKITGNASSDHPKLENSSEPWTVRLPPKTEAARSVHRPHIFQPQQDWQSPRGHVFDESASSGIRIFWCPGQRSGGAPRSRQRCP